MGIGLRHDLPHYTIFHSRNSTGQCPICLSAEAHSWPDLESRLEQALIIARGEVQRERQEKYAHLADEVG